jgi:hypothetical protein
MEEIPGQGRPPAFCEVRPREGGQVGEAWGLLGTDPL